MADMVTSSSAQRPRPAWWAWVVCLLLAPLCGAVLIASGLALLFEVNGGFGGPFDSSPHPGYVAFLVTVALASVLVPIGLAHRLLRSVRAIALVAAVMGATVVILFVRAGLT